MRRKSLAGRIVDQRVFIAVDAEPTCNIDHILGAATADSRFELTGVLLLGPGFDLEERGSSVARRFRRIGGSTFPGHRRRSRSAPFGAASRDPENAEKCER